MAFITLSQNYSSLDGEHLTVSLFAIPKAAPRFIPGEARGMVRHPSKRLRERGHLRAVSDWDTETGRCRELGSLLRMSLGIKEFLKTGIMDLSK